MSMRVLLADALAEMKASGWQPVSFPAFTDGRGSGVIQKNTDGIHVTHQQGSDGWEEEVSYWYYPDRTSACKACGGPSGQLCVVVAPVTVVEIRTHEQAKRIAVAWKLNRPSKPGRLVRYPGRREIRRRTELGSLHPRCMMAVLSRRGWNVDGTEGTDADPRMATMAEPAFRPDPQDIRETGRTETKDERRIRLFNQASKRNAQRLAEYRMWSHSRGSYAYKIG